VAFVSRGLDEVALERCGAGAGAASCVESLQSIASFVERDQCRADSIDVSLSGHVPNLPVDVRGLHRMWRYGQQCVDRLVNDRLTLIVMRERRCPVSKKADKKSKKKSKKSKKK
jgi:hypothetical protein